MNTDTVIYLVGTVNLFLGWLIAYASYRKKLNRIKETNRNARNHLKSVCWHQGWERGVTATLELVNESEKKRLAALGFHTSIN